MKILIADSGSTKTEWAVVDENDVQTLVTEGINPVHMTDEAIRAILSDGFTLSVEGIDAVWFYGAGCLPSKREGVTDVLRRFFRTGNVTVESDLLAAARGLLGNRAGVACILGTGSNSALYDGDGVVKNTPPLGYILGDEGSGADLGKRWIGDLLKGILPVELSDAFYAAYPLDYDSMIESIYGKPGANRFLAQFCPFLCKHIGLRSVRGIVEQAFSDFIERNLLPYEGVRELPVSFVGSVAFYFEKQLRDVMGRYGLTTGKIERSPMEGLVRYHRRISK